MLVNDDKRFLGPELIHIDLYVHGSNKDGSICHTANKQYLYKQHSLEENSFSKNSNICLVSRSYNTTSLFSLWIYEVRYTLTYNPQSVHEIQGLICESETQRAENISKRTATHIKNGCSRPLLNTIFYIIVMSILLIEINMFKICKINRVKNIIW